MPAASDAPASAAAAANKSSDAGSSRAAAKFPTRSFHGALLALVLSLAVFRFFIQGELSDGALLSGGGRASCRQGRKRQCGGETSGATRRWGALQGAEAAQGRTQS